MLGILRPLGNPETLKTKILKLYVFQKTWILDNLTFGKHRVYMLKTWHLGISKIMIWYVQTDFEKGLVAPNTQISHPKRPGQGRAGPLGWGVFG